jgi:hypothetical protein
MRKLVLTALVATAGCAATAQPQPTEGVATTTTTQALSTAAPSAGDTGDKSKIPVRRNVPPPTGSSSGGTGTGAGGGTPGAWARVTSPANLFPGTTLLLTDGSILVQDSNSAAWWKLSPDASGNYVDGAWTQLSSPPNGYDPAYYASAVLPDGRVIVEGGEYNAWNPVWQTAGAIYDPTTDTWTSVAPPTNWQTIGDAQSVVFPDGRFYMADCCSTNAAVLDPKTLTWTAFGSGKADINDEESWTLLPSGQLLTVDANNTADLHATELFNPRTGTWSLGKDTPVQLPDTNADGSGSHELGPQVLRPDGTVLAVGATGHTAVYHPRANKWTAGPDFPNVAGQGQLDVADGPAVLEPNGNVLIFASPGVFNPPGHMFEFDGRALTEIAAPPNVANDPSFYGNFLVLPNGQILFTDFSNDVEVFTPTGKAQCGWEPQIDVSCGLEVLTPGSTHEIAGTQLNGLSQAVAYGDDAQAATNYPLVRITNLESGHVTYARTHDHSSMSVASGAWSHTSFDVPAAAEAGPSELAVVANGIPSQPIIVVVVPADAR